MKHETPYITIFCASSPLIDEVYYQDARSMTQFLVENHFGIKYGGGAIGLMGTVADTVLQLDGEIMGIIPTFMVEVEWEHKQVMNMVHVKDMAHRKKLLMSDTQAIIVLPGGTGTLEEFFEAVSLKKLGFHQLPIIILNTAGFYNPLKEMLHRMEHENFLSHTGKPLYQFIEHPEEIIEILN